MADKQIFEYNFEEVPVFVDISYCQKLFLQLVHLFCKMGDVEGDSDEQKIGLAAMVKYK